MRDIHSDELNSSLHQCRNESDIASEAVEARDDERCSLALTLCN